MQIRPLSLTTAVLVTNLIAHACAAPMVERAQPTLIQATSYPLPLYTKDGRGSADTEKMDYVREMMSHSWSSYIKYAAETDELQPVSKNGSNWYGEHTLLFTPTDSLDTLHIMGLEKEYKEAKEMVLNVFDANVPITVSVFETTIRALGGMLAAYEFDPDQRMLEKATDLADRLLGAFETSTGLPFAKINLANGADTTASTIGRENNIAEMGSVQLEMQYLSDITGNRTYAEKALKVFDILHSTERPVKGLYPLHWPIDSPAKFIGKVDLQYGVGAYADSFYEYLLKIWLATGESKYGDWYHEAAEGIAKNLVRSAANGEAKYIPDARSQSDGSFKSNPDFQHLTCFAGGMFALGAAAREETISSQFDIGRAVTEACWQSYRNTATGVGPELTNGKTLKAARATYQLRPEALESVFYMWRLTHNPEWREKGWKMIQALNQYARQEAGFSSLGDVNNQQNPQPTDIQHSFWLAETLKYAYLLFTDDDVVPLEGYVFNTEAHPFSVRGFGQRKDLPRGKA
ncbi:glycosyl hydrolase [Phlyctochytrium arcticum]|nr:glycosyl hydrolase [Phlyctochytrium arcticum]